MAPTAAALDCGALTRMERCLAIPDAPSLEPVGPRGVWRMDPASWTPANVDPLPCYRCTPHLAQAAAHARMGDPATMPALPWHSVVGHVLPWAFRVLPGGCGLPGGSAVRATVEASGCLVPGGGLAAAAAQGSYLVDILFTAVAVSARRWREDVRWVASGVGGLGDRLGCPRNWLAAACWCWLVEGRYVELAAVVQWLCVTTFSEG